MPNITLTFSYDGSDSEIMQALARIGSALGGPSKQNGSVSGQNSNSVERIATKFAGYISRKPRLKNVMVAWLKRDGKILLSELVKVSGVAKQHDYAGIGSALTRNMKKAHGPKDWYDGAENAQGDWVYEIAEEFKAPLKRAFGL